MDTNQKQMAKNKRIVPLLLCALRRVDYKKKSLIDSDEADDKESFWNWLPHRHEIGFSAPNQENARTQITGLIEFEAFNGSKGSI